MNNLKWHGQKKNQGKYSLVTDRKVKFEQLKKILRFFFQIWRSDCTLGFLRKSVDGENLNEFGKQTN